MTSEPVAETITPVAEATLEPTVDPPEAPVVPTPDPAAALAEPVVVPDPVVTESPTPTDAPSGEARDFAAEITAANTRLEELGARVAKITDADAADGEALAKIEEEINKAITAHADLLSEQAAHQEALAKTQSAVEEVSQATQALNPTIADLQRQIDEQMARANKAELLAGEFSDIATFRDLIIATTDIEAMRTQCQKIRDIREKDRSEIRRTTGSERPAGPQGQGYPARIEITDDPAQIDQLLADAFERGGMAEFDRVTREVTARLETRPS